MTTPPPAHLTFGGKMDKIIKKCTKIENATPNLVKTNEVVWDAIRIAMDPEKKLRIAEIEIYR